MSQCEQEAVAGEGVPGAGQAPASPIRIAILATHAIQYYVPLLSGSRNDVRRHVKSLFLPQVGREAISIVTSEGRSNGIFPCSKATSGSCSRCAVIPTRAASGP